MILRRDEQTLHCEHCGATEPLPQPSEGQRIFDVIDRVAATIDWFAVQHPRGCGALEVRERLSGGFPRYNQRRPGAREVS